MNEYLSANQALLAVTDQGKSLDGSLTGSSLARQIAFGVLRHYFELASKVDCLVSKPLPEKNADIQLLIMSGIYSIDHLNRPVHASVNACVEATSDLNKVWAKKLVNGVLRSYLRKKEQIVGQIQADPESVTNHPQWLISRIEAAYPDQALAIFEANNVQPPMTLRVNLKQQSREEYLERLASIDIDACIGKHAPTAIYLSRPVAVDKLPNFDTGAASVQDEASQLVAPMMDIAAGMDVLDACAAPGGKTCHLLEAQNVDVVAVELEERRIGRMKENLLRMGLTAEIICADASAPDQWWDGQLFDRILLDAPCSATGVIRRNPDIKMLRTSEDILVLVQLQLKLLHSLWPLLKPGGYMVYATCSVLRQENDRLVARFLAQQPKAHHCVIEADWGVEMDIGRQLFPNPISHDGFYYAKLHKPL